MKGRNIISICLIALVGFTFSGCKPIEDVIVKDPVDTSTLKEYTPAEYETRMNSYLLTIMTNSQTILANNWQIETGGLSKEDAIKIIDSSMKDNEQTLRNIRQVTPPTTHVEHKQNVIDAINDYQSYLLDYKSALQETDKNQINSKAKRIEAHVGVLKNLQIVNQGYKF